MLRRPLWVDVAIGAGGIFLATQIQFSIVPAPILTKLLCGLMLTVVWLVLMGITYLITNL